MKPEAHRHRVVIASSSSPYLSCCQTPTQEYVVPKSMPTAGPSALLMSVCVCVCRHKYVRRNLSSRRPRARRNRRRPRKDSFGDFDESRTVDSSTTPPAAASVSTVAEEASIVLLRRLFGYSDIRTVRIVCVSSARAGCPSKLLDASFETLLPLHRVVVLVFKKSVGTG